MDKSWITKPRNTVEYSIGLQKFLDFDFENGASGNTIRCPCPKCGFLKWQARGIVEEHLILKQFPINYVIWNLHGERQRQDISRNEDESQETFHFENPMETMIKEAFGQYRQEDTNIGRSRPLGEDDVINERPRENHNCRNRNRDGTTTIQKRRTNFEKKRNLVSSASQWSRHLSQPKIATGRR
ncbi:hypothetical protein V8G54_004709 [Vigna mungo]|uniref:Transposase-associated domain-containing protein n=1 Tax=Vigna mungo TaxID=3915 RepID=A0AAQ3PHZ9_VIGMU